ncbi:MAG: site-2 protease family protein [Oscillospiraceae bacterium]|nr:site-2 protease family protein [Oscillospiraceae bacterium]
MSFIDNFMNDVFAFRPVFALMNFLLGPSQGSFAVFVISCFSVAVMIFVVFPIRESAQGYMAKYLGDDTAERNGRLTLNPLVHIDPMGAVMMLFAPFGWGKPVPVNPARCHRVNARKAVTLIALSGPVANVLLGYVFMVISKIILLASGQMTQTLYYVMLAMGIIVQLNVWIAVLNMLPLPQFAGGKILFAYLSPQKYFRFISFYTRHQQLISIGLLFLLIWSYSPLRILLEMITFGLLNLLDLLSKFLG